MKFRATIAAIVFPLLVFAQSFDCKTSGFADSLTVGGCAAFIYKTPGLDVDGIPIDIYYQRRTTDTPTDSVFVWWTGHLFYQAETDSVTLWESMQAYNMAIRQIFPE